MFGQHSAGCALGPLGLLCYIWDIADNMTMRIRTMDITSKVGCCLYSFIFCKSVLNCRFYGTLIERTYNYFVLMFLCIWTSKLFGIG